MTTHVPDATPAERVDEVRAREAAHTRQLAAEGHVLRLWRPPLEPGEWRTLGLFAATDDAELEEVLASMPLRIWRSDEVTTLARHPNDPARQTNRLGSPVAGDRNPATEFLTAFTRAVPAGTPAKVVDDLEANEARRASELARQGHLLRLWTLPGQGQALGLWRAHDPAVMQTIIESLLLFDWMTTVTTPLTPHPSDPAIAGG